jgi:integrase
VTTQILKEPESGEGLAGLEEGGEQVSAGFHQVAEAYLEDLRLRTDKRNSIRCAEYQIDRLIRAVPALRSRRIRREDLRAFIQTRLGEGVTAATINQGLSVAKSVIRFGVREGRIKDAEIDFRTFALKKTARDRYLPQDQIEKLLETARYIDARVYPLIYLAYHSGARLGELLQMRWGWIDLETGRIQIRNTADWTSKTREGRVLYLPPDVLEWLRAYYAELSQNEAQDPVLQIRPGKPWTEHVHKVLRKVFTAAGIDSRIGVHGLRHSSVTDMLESGVPVHIVQQHHGHKDSTTTLRHYAHAREGALREAAQLMASKRRRRVC